MRAEIEGIGDTYTIEFWFPQQPPQQQSPRDRLSLFSGDWMA